MLDKTQHIYNLYLEQDRYHFLSRPRRFGKSLLISTLHELFTGNRELFKGLWIDSSDFEFGQHPVIHLDFSTISHASDTALRISLSNHLYDIARQYKIDIEPLSELKDIVRKLVTELAQINQVVLLVDEYDHPMLSYISRDIVIAEANQKVLKEFYDTIKGLDVYFHAIFVTGVTKFSKTSIFSGFNTLHDISENEEFCDILGYSEEEIDRYFGNALQTYAEKKHSTVENIKAEMKLWYNGYRFSTEEKKVYNPYSIAYFLKNKKLANYWFASGTPTFLIELLSKDPLIIHNIEGEEINESSFNSWDLGSTPIIAIMYQAGYLTIKGYSASLYTLGFPNEEVRRSVALILTGLLTKKEHRVIIDAFSKMRKALREEDITTFSSLFQSLLAGIPYQHHRRDEAFYHALFEFLVLGLGFEGESEVATSNGRIDFVLTTDTTVLLFECKLNLGPEKALNQILDKRYAEKYATRGKKIVLVGMSFNFDEKEFSIECIQQNIFQTQREL